MRSKNEISPPAAAGLKSMEWFPGSSGSGPAPRGAFGKLIVGTLFGGLLLASHHLAPAIAVFVIVGALFLLGVASPRIQRSIDAALARFGQIVGGVVGGSILAGVYLCIFVPMRVLRWLAGADDLHLRDSARTSYWLPCDTDRRKVRYVGTMFATETAVGRRGNPWIVMLVTCAALFVLSEGILRIEGYGSAVRYIADPIVGYYSEPNVRFTRTGTLVATNRFGMRSPNFELKKPQGTFRILLLGDSTLYGGSYVDQRDLYSTRLQTQLQRRLPHGNVEVLAMGVNGWGPFHERGYVAKFGLFDADLVMVNLPIDDVNRPLYGLMDIPFFSVQRPPRLALEEVMNHFIWEYRKTHAGLDAKWEAVQSQIGIREYGKLADDLRAQGVEVAFACLPSRDPGCGRPEPDDEALWRGQLERTLAERGIKMSFPKGLFVGKGDPDTIYHDEYHLVAKGHHLYADYLESHIAADSVRFRQFVAGLREP